MTAFVLLPPSVHRPAAPAQAVSTALPRLIASGLAAWGFLTGIGVVWMFQSAGWWLIPELGYDEWHTVQDGALPAVLSVGLLVHLVGNLLLWRRRRWSS
jgi:hypothetical protein